MQTSDLGARTSTTPAYSGNNAAKNTKQQMDSSVKVQDEVARMIEKTTLTFPFAKADLFKGSDFTGETPLEVAGRYNQTEASYK